MKDEYGQLSQKIEDAAHNITGDELAVFSNVTEPKNHSTIVKYMGKGMVGIQGPLYEGTGCFHRRKVIYGLYPNDLQSKEKGKLAENDELVREFGISKEFIKSAGDAFGGNSAYCPSNNYISDSIEAAYQVANCDYESGTNWGKRVGIKQYIEKAQIIQIQISDTIYSKKMIFLPNVQEPISMCIPVALFVIYNLHTLSEYLETGFRFNHGKNNHNRCMVICSFMSHTRALWIIRHRQAVDLPRVDTLVTTANPMLEPPIITVNIVLSLMAVDYPAHKLACYVPDDGCSPLTFYSLVEASKLWVPFCNKFNTRVSGLMTNAPFMLNVDCDMFANNPQIVRQAMCLFLGSNKERESGFIQCPQFFYDSPADHLVVFNPSNYKFALLIMS
ncbi:hypothetical protein Q3G72_011643 [Acer saccharum]|nr:hypothetical protein Q3G72_011643 [Acer saccharum]